MPISTTVVWNRVIQDGKSTKEDMLLVVQKCSSSRSVMVKFAGKAVGCRVGAGIDDTGLIEPDTDGGFGGESIEATVGGPRLRGWVWRYEHAWPWTSHFLQMGLFSSHWR